MSCQPYRASVFLPPAFPGRFSRIAALLALFSALVLGLYALSTRPALAQTSFAQLDLGGVVVPGSSQRVELTMDVGPGTVERIGFDLTVTTWGSHWGNEVRILVIPPSGPARTFTGSDFGWSYYTGTHVFYGEFAFAPVSTPGTWRFQFYSIWSGSGQAQTYQAGSWIRLYGASSGDALDLDLSASAVGLTRGVEMPPVTATVTGGSGNYAFSVLPALPAGLTLDPATGTISGTPTVAAPQTTHTVTVTDLGGSGTTSEPADSARTASDTLVITVLDPPLCLSLSESSVTLLRGTPMTPISATASGGSGSYAFSVSPALPAGLAIDPASGTISGTPTQVSPRETYLVTVTCTATTQPQTATAPVEIAVVEDLARVAQAFDAATGAFIARRNDRLISVEPQSWRLDHRRRVQGPGNLVLRADDTGLALRFNTAFVGSEGLWHAWAEGEYSRYDETFGGLGARTGDFGLLSLGVDRLFNDRLALGLMAQFDRASERSSAVADIEGTGWMVGPYVSAELREGLFLAARLAWGQTSNTTSVDVYRDGSPWFTGDFDTQRRLARVTLFGGHDLPNGLHIAPEVDLAWVQDRQGNYAVSDGVSRLLMTGLTSERLRLTLAATVEAALNGADGRLIGFVRPALFHDRETTGGTGKSRVAGSLEFGLRNGPAADWQGSAAVRLDGLGDSGFDAWSLRLNLSRRF